MEKSNHKKIVNLVPRSFVDEALRPHEIWEQDKKINAREIYCLEIC